MSAARRRFRPLVEALEDRCVPSTFQVTTTADVVDPLDGRLSLREAITRANNHAGPDTIVLTADHYNLAIQGPNEDGNATGDLDVTDDLTIAGTTTHPVAGRPKRTIIDGQGIDRVFDIAPFVVARFSKVTIQDGLTGEDGGGIRAAAGSAVTLTRCALRHNTAGFNGGGIAVGMAISEKTYASAATDSTVFETVAISSQLTLVKSVVRRNTSNGSGGGIAGSGVELSLIGSTMRGNLAGDEGGGIYTGFVRFHNPSIVTLTHSTIRGNQARLDGGGILVEDEDTLAMTDCTVSGNTAGGQGGGIAARKFAFGLEAVAESSVSLTDCTVRNNQGLNGGGIFAFNYHVTLQGGTVSANRAARDGGGIFTSRVFEGGGGTLILTESTVMGNTAGGNGGGIANINDETKLTRSTVSDNRAVRDGGGIFTSTFGGREPPIVAPTAETAEDEGHTLILTDSTVSGNTAGRNGGGIANIDDETKLTRSTVSDNRAVGHGGGIFTFATGGSDCGGTLILTDSTISGNEAGGQGGGIAGVNDEVNLLRSRVNDNRAAGDGGGILITGHQGDGGGGCSLTLVRSAINKNTTGGRGGGIAAVRDHVTLDHSTVRGNQAAGDGGGIYTSGVGGGASAPVVVSADHVHTLILTDSTISGNTSAGNGGGIAALDDEVRLARSTISGNHAGSNGGGIFTGHVQGGFLAASVADEDFWAASGASVGDLAFVYVDTRHSTPSQDSFLELFANDGTTLIGFDDDGGPGTSSAVAGVVVPQDGDVFFKVTGFEGQAIGQYEIYQVIADPANTAAEVEANDTFGNANTINTTITTGAVGADDDFFKFPAAAGDSIVVILDNDPERDDVLANATLAILDTDGVTELALENTDPRAAAAAGAVIAPSAGTYYIRVGNGGSVDNTSSYRFVVIVSANIVDETEPNDIPASANALASGQAGSGMISGGGGQPAGSTLEANNSTISGNTADGNGGGIYTGLSDTAEFTNLTIAFNAAASGGGVFNSDGGRVQIVNTLIARNTAAAGAAAGPDVFGAFESLGYNLIRIGDGSTGFSSTLFDQVGTSTAPIKPRLGPLQDNGGPTFTHALLPGSPAIDAGDDTAAPATDQRGVSRPQGDRADIGAFEVFPEATPTDD